MRLTDDDRRARLAQRHLLGRAKRADATVATIADALVALHSSDPVTVYLSVSARAPTATVESVAAELYDAPTVVRHHAMRRTLWVMTPAVAAAAHAACTRKIAVAERPRSCKLIGRDAAWFDDAVARVVEAVARREGPVSTRELGGLLPDLAERITVATGKSYEGTISVHARILLQAAFEGRIVRTRPAGSWTASQYAWTLPDRWIRVDWDAHDVDGGHAALVARWLAAFGPGTLADIVWWSGSTKTAIRRALATVDAGEVELDDGSTGYVAAGDTSSSGDGEDDPGAWVALLPGLDPTPMGWKQRGWYLAPDVAERVVDRNGNIGPTVWVDGRIVGGWVQRSDGEIVHDADVPATHGDLLDAEVDRVRRFAADTRFKVRFPSPNQQRLRR